MITNNNSKSMLENYHVKSFIKLLDVINVVYGFTLNGIKLIFKLTNTSKTTAVPGIVFPAQVKYFLFQT